MSSSIQLVGGIWIFFLQWALWKASRLAYKGGAKTYLLLISGSSVKVVNYMHISRLVNQKFMHIATHLDSIYALEVKSMQF